MVTTGITEFSFVRAKLGSPHSWEVRMFWTAVQEWTQKRRLREMLNDPRATRGFRSTGQLEKGIGANRATTERLLLAVGARKSDVAEEWTLRAFPHIPSAQQPHLVSDGA